MFSGKLFRSRWAALLWSAGILWTAYDIASASAPTKHDQSTATTQGAAASAGSDENQNLAVLRRYAGG